MPEALTKASNMPTPPLILLLLAACSFLNAAQVHEATTQVMPIQVAVASNFSGTAAKIVSVFSLQSGYQVILIPGSTGKHYAQILHGAPFDVFLAADRRRPQLLDENGLAVAGSRFTYAVGQLAFWAPETDFGIDSDVSSDKLALVTVRTHLLDSNYRFLAIANPALAPYGRAARESLEKMGLWEKLSKRMVRGENISQAYHFVSSGNAQIGLVAYSQLLGRQNKHALDYILLPQDSYSPIEQQAILIQDSPAASAFMNFLKSPECLEII